MIWNFVPTHLYFKVARHIAAAVKSSTEWRWNYEFIDTHTTSNLLAKTTVFVPLRNRIAPCAMTMSASRSTVQSHRTVSILSNIWCGCKVRKPNIFISRVLTRVSRVFDLEIFQNLKNFLSYVHHKLTLSLATVSPPFTATRSVSLANKWNQLWNHSPRSSTHISSQLTS